jgi:hypothetical protein
MRAPTRRRLLVLALAAVALAAAPPAKAQKGGPDREYAARRSVEITARPIAHFDRARPNTSRFGALEFRGGLVLGSSDTDFGGWSGLIVGDNGDQVFAVSDAGSWLSADIAYEAGRPVRLTNAFIGPLAALSGRSLEAKREQDAEAVTLLDGTLARGTLAIGFERLHRIGRFQIAGNGLRSPTGYYKLPPEARHMQRNQGLEALAVIRAGPLKGSLVAFAERFTRGSGYHTGWIWVQGVPRQIHLRDDDGFNITDAAGLPDGGLLILERYFRWTSGVKMRIRRLSAADIKPGAKLVGRTLVEADSGFEIDNMEGIAVHRGATGETVVTLISDDNFNRFLQRTILLQFILHDD